jgi:hypothetical protein
MQFATHDLSNVNREHMEILVGKFSARNIGLDTRIK